MITHGTEHLSVDVFNSAFRVARPGDQIVYAHGDLAYSRHTPEGKDLDHLAKRTSALAGYGLVCLTQRATFDIFRNGGGRSFEYIATKCQPKTSTSTRSRGSSSQGAALATA